MASGSCSAHIAWQAAGNSRRVVVCSGGVISVCTAYFLAERPVKPPSPQAVRRFRLRTSPGRLLLHRQLADLASEFPAALLSPSLSVSQNRPPGLRHLSSTIWVDCPTTWKVVETVAFDHPQLTTEAPCPSYSPGLGVGWWPQDVQRIRLNGTEDCAAVKMEEPCPADTVWCALGPWVLARLPLDFLFVVFQPQSAHHPPTQEPNIISPAPSSSRTTNPSRDSGSRRSALLETG
ncbi:hypothetical protein HPP92_028936 [Vanilla planifolia]|uniref:Uncharacterized protein n=1 Tax=Vanilla planifolia TaxID=51239 RepID=A0A835P917_VANPL|nr:hypothetical protein HPP92_028926 [Vanilla planifolia]KAG0446233.1 hypothetical protein HPP92_028936 [Vanilla planifolia]